MVVAEMEYNCGINSWKTNSEIVFAQTSDNNYISKYSRINRMLVPFAHSPDIIYASNTNEYVLIYAHNKTNNDVRRDQKYTFWLVLHLLWYTVSTFLSTINCNAKANKYKYYSRWSDCFGSF